MNDEIKVVKGGTPKSPISKRMKEFAYELKVPSNHDDQVVVISDAISEGIDETIGAFNTLTLFDINIVGSRGYVYDSSKILEMLKSVKNGTFSMFDIRLFTRSLGLRDMVKGEFGSKWCDPSTGIPFNKGTCDSAYNNLSEKWDNLVKEFRKVIDPLLRKIIGVFRK